MKVNVIIDVGKLKRHNIRNSANSDCYKKKEFVTFINFYLCIYLIRLLFILNLNSLNKNSNW